MNADEHVRRQNVSCSFSARVFMSEFRIQSKDNVFNCSPAGGSGDHTWEQYLLGSVFFFENENEKFNQATIRKRLLQVTKLYGSYHQPLQRKCSNERDDTIPLDVNKRDIGQGNRFSYVQWLH